MNRPPLSVVIAATDSARAVADCLASLGGADGVEVIVAPGEDPERPVMRLLARTAQPIVTADSVRQAIKTYTGAVPLMAPSIQCGVFAAAPSVCNAFIRAYQWDGTKLVDASDGYVKVG